MKNNEDLGNFYLLDLSSFDQLIANLFSLCVCFFFNKIRLGSAQYFLLCVWIYRDRAKTIFFVLLYFILCLLLCFKVTEKFSY